jgi:hypothetical protein
MFVAAPISIPAAQATPVTAQDDCTAWRPTLNGEGTRNMTVNANLKVAFYASCGNVVYLHKGDVFYEHCWAVNNYDNTWFYGRVKGTSITGWMNYNNLGSVYNDENGDDRISEEIC